MTTLRRRALVATEDQQPAKPTARTSRSFRPLVYNAVIILVLTFLLHYLTTYLTFTKPKYKNFPTPFLPFATPPDNETVISSRRIRLEDRAPPDFHESAIVCMPTVVRENVEYVSNSVKSFRLATGNSSNIRRLIVYMMDDPPVDPIWLKDVFANGAARWIMGEKPSWLQIKLREGKATQPRKTTLGDSWERVLWRSKEALDYAQVLERCAAATDAPWVIVVQDDILFRKSITEVVAWAEKNVVDEPRIVNERPVARVCSGSLFDISDEPADDGDELRSSNMVARIWRKHDIEGWVTHLRERFDDAPVDWLTDRRCRGRRGWVPVMWPNAVRHRGKISSFSKNEREGLLT